MTKVNFVFGIRSFKLIFSALAIFLSSLKDGIKDGFLTPFKVKRIQTTLDEYVYTGEDDVIEGEEELEVGKVFKEPDFNTKIRIIIFGQ